MSIYRLFRFNFWKQFTDAPNMDANLLLIQLQDFWKQFTDTPNTDVNLLLIQIQGSWKQFMDASQHGCQSIACSDSTSSIMKIVYGCFSTWMSIYRLFRFNFWKQFTDASQTWMLIYCLFNFKTSENSLRILQTWMLIYRLFRFNFWKQFTDAYQHGC